MAARARGTDSGLTTSPRWVGGWPVDSYSGCAADGSPVMGCGYRRCGGAVQFLVGGIVGWGEGDGQQDGQPRRVGLVVGRRNYCGEV